MAESNERRSASAKELAQQVLINIDPDLARNDVVKRNTANIIQRGLDLEADCISAALAERVRATLIALFGAPRKCTGCHAVIYWAETKGGRRTPINEDGTSHFMTCPNADSFRRRVRRCSRKALDLPPHGGA